MNFVRSFRTKFFRKAENFDFYLCANVRPFATISGNFKTSSEGDKVDFLSVIACELAWRSARLVILLQWKRQPTADALLPWDVYAFPLIPRSLWIVLSLLTLAEQTGFDCKDRCELTRSLISPREKRQKGREDGLGGRKGRNELAWGAKARDKQAKWSTAKENNPSAYETKESRARNKNPATLFLQSRSKYCPLPASRTSLHQLL